MRIDEFQKKAVKFLIERIKANTIDPQEIKDAMIEGCKTGKYFANLERFQQEIQTRIAKAHVMQANIQIHTARIAVEEGDAQKTAIKIGNTLKEKYVYYNTVTNQLTYLYELMRIAYGHTTSSPALAADYAMILGKEEDVELVVIDDDKKKEKPSQKKIDS